MSCGTSQMSTRQWSTGTLDDGVQHVSLAAKAETVEETESDLERQLQERVQYKLNHFSLQKDVRIGDDYLKPPVA